MDPFPALADPVRRSILRTLARGSARVVDLADAQPVSRPAVSRHLRVLEEVGLVTGEDRGRERHYALAPDGLEPVVTLLADLADLAGDPSPRARFDASAFDGLDLEVRRTARDQQDTRAHTPSASTASEETA